MQKFIHHLRRQPESTRRYILHFVVGVAAVILVVAWVFTLGTNFASGKAQSKLKEDVKPFSALKSNILDGYNSLGE